MANLKYVFKRLFHMNYGAMLKKINSIHKKTGKGRLFIFRDMKDCAVKYGAGYMDYDLFEMYNMNDAQRDTCLTRGRNDALVKKYNDPAYAGVFISKLDFNERFAKYVRRDFVAVKEENREEILAFLEKHPIFVAKPVDGACGKGIEKLNVADYAHKEACLAYLLGLGGNYELEELLTQHPAVSAIYPHAINTVRAVTILQNGEPHLVCTYFRIGNGGRHVDNFNSGGMVVPVDEKTGTVLDKAIDKTKALYAEHPMTGTPIKGFQFPDWDKAIELVHGAAREIPQMAYVGWDIAFTPNGPCLVEGNNFPGHDIYQLPEHTPEKIGVYPKFRPYA